MLGFVSPQLGNRLFGWFARASALLVLLLLIALIGALIYGAYPAFSQFGWAFLSSAEWDPVNQVFGALGTLTGTLLTAGLAMLVAIPLSFSIAIFLTEYCPAKLRFGLGLAVELLAAIPSIIYGMWGLFVFAPLMMEHVQPAILNATQNTPYLNALFAPPAMGIGVFTASLILAMMVLPFMTAMLRDVFLLTPAMLKESAYGLGSTRWEVLRRVVLPYSSIGVIGAVLLALGRALGETMAVTFVIGNAHRLGINLFGPSNSIASALANEFAEAQPGLHMSSLLALGLLLFVITTFILALARLFMQYQKRKLG